MLNKIIGFSIKNKLIIALLTIAWVIYGAFEVTKLPIDAVPDITNNQVQIITIAPSYGATDIERLVTFPVEQANSNIAGVKEVRSYSRFGLSLVTLVFEDNVDIYWARQQVAERLLVVQESIPKGIGKPEMGPISTGLGEIYQYTVKAKPGYEKKYDITELRTIQDWLVRRQLLGVKGIAEVSSFGGKLKQYEVAINPNRLQAQGVTLEDVFNALENNNQNTGGAYIEKQNTVLYIRSEGLIGSQEDIENIMVKTTTGGVPLLIKDVATVGIGYATRYGALIDSEQGEVSGAIVLMLKGENSNVVVANIKKKITEIQETLPEGVVIEPFLDRTNMVNNAIKTVETNLLEGALIVIFVLVVFLGNFRAGFLVASVIPLSMLFAVIMMNIFGVSGNLMSLGALDFGLIVDGAVIIVEAVMHQLAHRKRWDGQEALTQIQMDSEVKGASSKMMNSAVFGQIIILIVYLPIFTLQGIEGKMFKPMAQTVAFALLGAFILSLTYIPMMSSIFLSKELKQGANLSDKIMTKIERAYQALLARVLNFRKTIITGVLMLFATAVMIMGNLGGEFIPSIEEGDFAVETRILSGSNLNTTIDNVHKVAKLLKSRFPEVKNIVAKIGSSEVPTEPLPMDMGDMIINLASKDKWVSATSFEELSEKMAKVASEIPGVTTSFQFPVQMRFNELMTGARQDVVCKIFGEDFETLGVYAQKVGKLLRTIDGANEIYIEQITGIPQIVISYNRATIAQYGLNIAAINRMVNASFAGQSAGLVFEGEKRFDLVVRLQQNQRKDLSDVQNLLIPTATGKQIPLYQLAKVELVDSPSQIQREDTKRRILVGFNVSGRDVESIVKELQEKIKTNIHLPTGYTISYGGSFENLNEAKTRLSIAVPVSLVLIFLLLYFAFGSIKYGLLIYSAIPLSAIGGIFLLAARGMPFSISAGVGFIALFGIAVLNGIVLVAEFNNLKKRGEKDMKKIVLEGTRTRLRPVLMTAFVASLGFLPMALSNGAGAAVQRPLATVVIGGLLFATLLTLFVLPTLYILFEKGIKIKPKFSVIILLAGLLFVHGETKAQQSISLSAAIDSALRNNLTLKNQQLKVNYTEKLIGSAIDITPTSITAEYGKFNSSLNDNRFSINQAISFPSLYSNQRKQLIAEWKMAVVSKELKTADIKKMISLIFFEYLVNQEQLKILKEAERNYQRLLDAAKARLRTGETNLLEKAGAESQLIQNSSKVKQLKQQAQVLLQEFAMLLNIAEVVIPQSDSFKVKESSFASARIEDHPYISILKQQEAIAASAIKVEQSRLLPGISFGYNNLSLRDNTHTFNNRFQSVQIGLNIPLLGGAQQAKIKAAKVNQEAIKVETQVNRKQLQLALRNTFTRFEQQKEIVQDFEQTGLPNAKDITMVLNKQLANGEINYLEWTALNNQALEIYKGYFLAVNELNNTTIELDYLLNP